MMGYALPFLAKTGNITLSKKEEVGGVVRRGGLTLGVIGGESGVTKD
jgi:hypothetical protein